MPFNHGPITEGEEATAWEELLREHAGMKKLIGKLMAERNATWVRAEMSEKLLYLLGSLLGVPLSDQGRPWMPMEPRPRDGQRIEALTISEAVFNGERDSLAAVDAPYYFVAWRRSLAKDEEE